MLNWSSWAAATLNSHLHRHSPSLLSPAVPRLVHLVAIVLLPVGCILFTLMTPYFGFHAISLSSSNVFSVLNSDVNALFGPVINLSWASRTPVGCVLLPNATTYPPPYCAASQHCHFQWTCWNLSVSGLKSTFFSTNDVASRRSRVTRLGSELTSTDNSYKDEQHRPPPRRQ